MKYAGMPFGMWVLFAGSFQKQLTDVLGYDAATARAITKNAKPQYRQIIAGLPEFEKADRFKMNLVNCAMVGAFILSMPQRPEVDRLTDYYARSMMTKPMQWFCRKSGKSKFTPKDIAAMKATAALKAADRNPYSWNMEFYEYPDGSGYEGRFTKCGICVLMSGNVLCGKLAFSALAAEPLHGLCHHGSCIVIRQPVHLRALRHGEDERAEHCAVDDVHLEAVRFFKLRQTSNDLPVLWLCLFRDGFCGSCIIAQHSGQLLLKGASKQHPHPHGHPGVLHCRYLPASASSACHTG